MITKEQKQKAKEVSLEIWKYMRDNKIYRKSDLPEELFEKIKHDENECPLCTLFLAEDDNYICSCNIIECPLYDNHDVSGNRFCNKNFYIWNDDDEEKDAACNEIVRLLEEWEIEE
jgi:hypothetical protein